MGAKARPIFYDTETTGTRADKDRIVEIAAYDPVENRVFEKLVHPGCVIPSEVTAIHGITNEMVANSPSFAEIGKEFIDFCSGNVVLIAHNNDNFDVHFLRNELNRHEIPMPIWKFFDTLKWARRYRPDLPRHTLQFLREIYGIVANQAHRALDDVIILHKVFSFMTGDLDMDTVYSMLNKPRDLQHMPWGKHQGTPLSKIPKDYVKWMLTNGVFDKPENSDLKISIEKLGLLELVAAR